MLQPDSAIKRKLKLMMGKLAAAVFSSKL